MKEPEPELVPVVEYLRQNFNHLNHLYFQETHNQDIKQWMSTVLEKCLSSFGKTHNCYGEHIELKLDRRLVENDFFIGDKVHTSRITGVYVYSCDKFVYKRTSFSIDNVNTFFKLVLEVCLQQYAHSLNCGMKIPEIYDCTLSQTGDRLSLEIKMEKIEVVDVLNEPVKQEILENHAFLIDAIKSGLDCFERHGLYHNDTHSENIGFYKDAVGNLQVVLMDFGKATLSDKNRYQSPSGFYEQLDDAEKFNEWLTHTVRQNTGRRNFYGGKKRRTNKKKKQRRRKTHCRK